MRTTRSNRMLVGSLLAAIVGCVSIAHAGNLCAILAVPIEVPIKACITPDVNPQKCMKTPHCCLPGGCFVDPICAVWAIQESTKQIAAGETYCDFTPDNFVKRWLAGQLLNIGNIVAAGLPQTVLDALSAEADFLAARGKNLPDKAKQTLKDLIRPVYDNGVTGYSYNDVDSIKVISDQDPDAALYLKPYGDNTTAVTLGPVLVIRKAYFDGLFEAYDLHDIQSGTASKQFIRSVDVVVHELNHVRQFRQAGDANFKTLYAADWLVKGGKYARSTYEIEAYTNTAALAMRTGGRYCTTMEAAHKSNIITYSLNLTYVCAASCTPTISCGSRVCGSIDDGCGSTVACGSCSADKLCVANGARCETASERPINGTCQEGMHLCTVYTQPTTGGGHPLPTKKCLLLNKPCP